MREKRTVLLMGILIGVLLFGGASLAGSLYRQFSWGGHQTFEIVIANDLFREDVVLPEDIEALTHTYGETVRWVMSRALAMKNDANLKKLAVMLDTFVKYDQEYYTRWLEERRSEGARKKFTF